MLNEQQVILSKLRLQSANEDYIIAKSLLNDGHYKAANNRAYYSVFHAIRAVLALESKDFKRHAQVIGYFNKEYIHAGHFEPRFFEIIKTASRSRTNSDYEDYYIATKEEAAENVSNAKLFLTATESYVAHRMDQEYEPPDSSEPEGEDKLEP
jgi:uncharacterized protein (UPF0332 family)